MAALHFLEARTCVVDRLREAPTARETETVPLADAAGRILAQSAHADRDDPPLPRSTRDGFALRAADTPGPLTIVGEIRAGQPPSLAVLPGEAVEVMTGAPLPAGADAVVMVEHVTAFGASIQAPVVAEGANISPQGRCAMAGQTLLRPGCAISYPQIALLAANGVSTVGVFRKPTVAILATGDELVPIHDRPEPHQIRNSNSWSLAAQVARAGALPVILPTAADSLDSTLTLLRQALDCDLVLISGGVSAGKYDLVEIALKQIGAEMFFDRVLIQPGQPCVFGRAGAKFFLGLPGNPASTMVCFELFARPAIEILSGLASPLLPLTSAPLRAAFSHKPGLTRFLPATLHQDLTIAPIAWSGSGDIAAMARANCYLVAAHDRSHYEAGGLIGYMPI